MRGSHGVPVLAAAPSGKHRSLNSHYQYQTPVA
jgi:hypothetical protein